MAAIAREAGISKALLYHYFPSKQAYFVRDARAEGGRAGGRSRPTRRWRRREQLAASLDAFLGWVEENGDAYAKLVRGAAPCRRCAR